jgi:hypothetical protein
MFCLNPRDVNRGYFNYRSKFGGHETTMKMLLLCPNKFSPHLDGCKFLHDSIPPVHLFERGTGKSIIFLGSKKVHGSV